jgi:propionyl-CoA carboxylase alpha chain
VVRIAGREHRLRFERFDGGSLAFLDDGAQPSEVIGRWQPGQLRFRGSVDGRARTVRIARRGRQWRLTTRGASHIADVLPAHVAELSRHMIEKVPPDLSRFLICPMPGLLTALHVGEGDHVEAGQPLAVVEAMKMENMLRAEKAGTVKSVAAKPGDSLAVDAVILEFE